MSKPGSFERCAIAFKELGDAFAKLEEEFRESKDSADDESPLDVVDENGDPQVIYTHKITDNTNILVNKTLD